jgi:hypothetical protein
MQPRGEKRIPGVRFNDLKVLAGPGRMLQVYMLRKQGFQCHFLFMSGHRSRRVKCLMASGTLSVHNDVADNPRYDELRLSHASSLCRYIGCTFLVA